MREANPYNAALCDAPGSRNVKHLARLIIPFVLAPLAAGATTPATTADEVRERLQPFGNVCRTADACPSAATVTGRNWQVVNGGGDAGEQAGNQGMKSGWIAAGIHWPEIAAGITVSPDSSASMQFTYLDLAGGEESRYGAWDNHWITLAAGERSKDFRVRKPAGQDFLLLGTGPTAFLTQAVTENAGETLMVRMQYQGTGDVVFAFPLAGARRTLRSIGFIEGPAEDDEDMAAAGTEEVVAAMAPVAVAGPGAERSGQQIYNTFCFACHATGVVEAPLFGSLEQWQPYIDKGLDTLVATSITGFDLMPPQGTCMSCTEDEMRASIQYMIDNAH